MNFLGMWIFIDGFVKWTADQAREFVKKTRDVLMNGESDVYYEM